MFKDLEFKTTFDLTKIVALQPSQLYLQIGPENNKVTYPEGKKLFTLIDDLKTIFKLEDVNLSIN